MVLLFLFTKTTVQAQFAKQWDRFYGGILFEEAKVLHELSDGYLVFGNASYTDVGDQPLTFGSSDFWLYKIDFDGNIVWQHLYGGTEADMLQDVYPTNDGGFILGGFSFSGIGGIKTGALRGDRDMWIVKIAADGTMQWDQTFGGDAEDYLSAIQQTTDGGYIFGGWTNSTVSGEVTETPRGERDYWLIKADANGNLIWNRRFGGDDNDLMQDIYQTPDGGFLLAGQSKSNISGEKSENSIGYLTNENAKIDYWIIKTDANGNLIWDRTFGGVDSEEAWRILPTTDGNYFIGGYSSSGANGNKEASSNGGRDYWLVKMDINGNKIWDRAYGGFGRDEIRNIRPLKKDRIGLLGFSGSGISGDKTELTRGANDYWFLMIDQAGDIVYQKTLGGSNNDNLFDVIQSTEGNLVLGGFTISDTGGDITDVSNGNQDNWIVKMNCTIQIDLGLDTLVCQYEPIILDPNNSSFNPCEYQWSTGATSSTLIVNPERDTSYAVTVTDLYGCVKRDTIFISTKEVPEFELGEDNTICTGDSIQLSIGNSVTPETIEWSTGSDAPTITVSNAADYAVTLTNTNACTFTDEITIDNHPLPDFDLGSTEFICPDESLNLMVDHPGPLFVWEHTSVTSQSVLVSDEGIYRVTVTDNNGCAKTDSVQLVFYDLPVVDLGSDTILCASDIFTIDATVSDCNACTYLWDDNTTEPIRDVQSDTQQTYQVTVTDGNACTASDDITIDINPNPTIELGEDIAICEGDSTLITFDLTGNAPFTVIYTDNISAENDTLVDISDGMGIWVNPTETTTYSIISVEDSSSPNTCSSIALNTKTINVYNHEETQLFIEICDGESHFTQGVEQTESGIYIDTLQTVFACDSIIFTNLTVNPLDTTTLLMTTCIAAEAGIDTVTFTNQYNCDSLVIEITDLLPSDTIYLEAESCNVFEEGLDTLFLNNQFGCDSLIITNTTLLPSSDTELYATSCDPDEEGVVWMPLTNQFGCDSLVVTITTYTPPDTTYLSVGDCNPNDVGLDTIVLANQLGCDSVIITETFLFPTDTTYINLQSCDPADVGADSLRILNQFTCDSLIITTTTLSPSDTTYLTDVSCDPADVGLDTLFIFNQFNCDSLVITNTSLVPTDTTYLTETTCQQDALVYEEIPLTNQFGCDSLIIIDRTIFSLDTTIIEIFTCDASDASLDSITVMNQFGCDSLVITNTLYTEADTTRLEQFTCDEDAVGVETEVFNTDLCDSIVITTTLLMADDTLYLNTASCNPIDTGVFISSFINTMGCDSVIIETVDLLPKDTIINQLGSCEITDIGMDTIPLTNQFGCDSLVINITTLLPKDTIYQTLESCIPSEAGLDTIPFTNQFGCDSLVIQETLLLQSDTTYLTAASCDPIDVGQDTLFDFNQYNCDSLIITTTTLLPTDTTYISEETCDQNALVFEEVPLMNQFGCDSLIVYNRIIRPLDTTFLEINSCDINDAGIDTLPFFNQFGCDSLVITNTTFVESDSTFLEVMTCDVSLLGTVIESFLTAACDSFVITTTVLMPVDTTFIQSYACEITDTGIFEYQFSTIEGCDSIVVDTVLFAESQDLFFNENVCSVLDTGLVVTEYVNQFGCDSIISIQYNLATDTIYIQETTCDSLDSYEILDSYVNEAGCDSTIITLITLLETSIVNATEFTCDPSEVEADTTFLINAVGCDSLFIQSVALFEIDIDLQIEDETCFEDNDGSLIIENIAGGQAPYLVSIDGGPFSSQTIFRNLGVGVHIMDVQDANGCEETIDFEIAAAEPFEVDLGEAITLNYGESTELNINTNQPIFSQIWADTTDMECPECPNPMVSPLNSTVYQVTVTNEKDCTASDNVRLIVETDRSIFIPSAFSPNGDQLNDVFIPFAGIGIQSASSLTILDRWGNIVYQSSSENILETQEGWDGTFNGKQLDAAVFVYMLEVTYVDGQTEMISGDVTLMR